MWLCSVTDIYGYLVAGQFSAPPPCSSNLFGLMSPPLPLNPPAGNFFVRRDLQRNRRGGGGGGG